MQGKFAFWISLFLVLILLVAPASSIRFTMGGNYPLRSCSHSICGDVLDPIYPDPALQKIMFVYNISDEKNSLEDNFSFNVSLIRNSKIGEVQAFERNGTVVFDNLTSQRRTRENYVIRFYYPNTSVKAASAHIKISIYLVKDGESDTFPTAAPPLNEPSIQPLMKIGVTDTLSLIRGQSFVYETVIAQPRIAGRNNITKARFWVFGDHYAEVTTVPVNRVNGFVKFSLSGNQTILMNDSSYQLYVEYPPEWDFFQVYLDNDECVGTGMCCSASCPLRLSVARSMNGSAGADMFETIVRSANLETPLYHAQITVLDDEPEKIVPVEYPSNSRINNIAERSTPAQYASLSFLSEFLIPLILGVIMRFFIQWNSKS